MSRKIINFPQPITVEYDDTPFYEMIEQYDNPRISDESAAVMVKSQSRKN